MLKMLRDKDGLIILINVLQVGELSPDEIAKYAQLGRDKLIAVFNHN